jgi:hypothetical protein
MGSVLSTDSGVVDRAEEDGFVRLDGRGQDAFGTAENAEFHSFGYVQHKQFARPLHQQTVESADLERWWGWRPRWPLCKLSARIPRSGLERDIPEEILMIEREQTLKSWVSLGSLVRATGKRSTPRVDNPAAAPPQPQVWAGGGGFADCNPGKRDGLHATCHVTWSPSIALWG